jgi:hypothetical protein
MLPNGKKALQPGFLRAKTALQSHLQKSIAIDLFSTGTDFFLQA